MLKNKTVLITGGTGSFGHALVERVIKDYPDVRRLLIFSRDELKQFEMSIKFSVSKYPFIRYFIGDVRDRDRLYRAFEGVDVVIHAAALKQVPSAEYNPMEYIKTNVLGAENIINAAIDTGVKKIVALSTDKAAAPINLYGATKLCSDKLFVAGNNMAGPKNVQFSVVRYGNVMGSRGSVIPFFLKCRKDGVLPITDVKMTRFNILLSESVDMVLHALEDMEGGEIFIPKIPSYKLTDLAEAIGPNCEIKDIGIRPGEKLHEEMITSSDSLMTVDVGDYYVILPQFNKTVKADYMATHKAKELAAGFSYSSGTNESWLTVNEIRELIRKHLDPSFDAEA